MYEAALKSAEVLDAVIRDGKEVPKPLLAYVSIALFSFDDLFKKHEARPGAEQQRYSLSPLADHIPHQPAVLVGLTCL